MSLFSTNVGVAVIDTRVRPGTITLPLTSQIPNRYLQFKDLYGSFGGSSLTLSTQGGESFDDGATSKVYTDPFTFIQLYAASTTKWAQLGGTQTISQTIASLNVSSVNGFPPVGLPSLQSSITGLGSAGYVSTPSLVSTTSGLEYFVSTSITNIPYIYTGTTLYMNYSIPVGSNKELGTQLLPFSPQQTVTTPLTANTNNVFVAAFQSDFAVPYVLPSGFWDVTVFTLASGTEVYMYASIYLKYDGIESLFATSSNVPQLVPQTLTELTTTLTVPYSTLSTSASIVIKLFANHPANGARTLSTLYQNGTYSHVHTTFGVILEEQVLTSTIVGLGTLGYISSSQLVSTTAGLGSLGYISSSQLISTVAGIGSGGGSAFTGSTNSLSSGQIFTSSIFGNQLQFITLSSQALFVSSFYTATRQATPMFLTF